MPDIRDSILSKLKNKAKTTETSYKQRLQLFFQEEFLRRLSKSIYAENLILKGGLFIYTLTNYESRTTVDIDFLLRHENSDAEHISKMIEEILATPTGNNEIVILKAEKSEPISAHRKYPGISTQIIGQIKNVRVPFDIDVGIGDVIVPNAQRRGITPQLEGYEKPEVLTYSVESTIAEKFEAILQRYELTGRMKDFYDIYYLSHIFNFEGSCLKEALFQTLTNRGTSFNRDSMDRIVALAQDSDMQTKWRYFLKTIKENDLDFTDVVRSIDLFLRPVWDALISETEFLSVWSCSQNRWTK